MIKPLKLIAKLVALLILEPQYEQQKKSKETFSTSICWFLFYWENDTDKVIPVMCNFHRNITLWISCILIPILYTGSDLAGIFDISIFWTVGIFDISIWQHCNWISLLLWSSKQDLNGYQIAIQSIRRWWVVRAKDNKRQITYKGTITIPHSYVNMHSIKKKKQLQYQQNNYFEFYPGSNYHRSAPFNHLYFYSATNTHLPHKIIYIPTLRIFSQNGTYFSIFQHFIMNSFHKISPSSI